MVAREGSSGDLKKFLALIRYTYNCLLLRRSAGLILLFTFPEFGDRNMNIIAFFFTCFFTNLLAIPISNVPDGRISATEDWNLDIESPWMLEEYIFLYCLKE
jgi:hypothetical protein